MNERSFYYIQTMHTLSKGKNSRANILRAAHDLFLQQGYHGTSMRQIAEGAGTALGAIYNHFPGKETIFRRSCPLC
jgi:AcrR family transcriptional regulator